MVTPQWSIGKTTHEPDFGPRSRVRVDHWVRIYTGKIKPSLLERQLTGCKIGRPQRNTFWVRILYICLDSITAIILLMMPFGHNFNIDTTGQRHQFNVASEAEGNALSDTLNANCVAIAHAQKAADSQKIVDLCATLHGTILDFADAKAAVRRFALATRDEVGTQVRSTLVLSCLVLC